MPYIQLFLAIALEVVGTTLLTYSHGFTKTVPTLGCALAYALCFWLLAKAIQTINLSVAYATWCGLGIVATTIISVLIFKGQLNIMTIFGIVLVVVGVIILNLYGTAH